MSFKALLSGLSHSEKLAAMELLWRDLSSKPFCYVSPEWHEGVIADRLANPAVGESLRLNDAKAEVKDRLDARRTQG